MASAHNLSLLIHQQSYSCILFKQYHSTDESQLVIDLRSDTITLPTPEMREAMAQAPLGDDVFSDDPTVNALEERTAEILGKEAAVYVPSGTMSNQIALRTHTEPGNEILIDENAHIYYYEE